MIEQHQIDQFHRDGFLALRQVFAGEELELLRLAADRVQADGVAGLGRDHRYHRFPDGIEVYHRSEGLWDRDPIFAAATAQPCLLEAIGQCLGHPFLPIESTLACQIPFGKVPLPWHQNPPYGDPGRQRTFGIPNFAAGIYLDHATRENGCLWSIGGHHLVGHVELENLSEEDLFSRSRPLEMAPEDVLFQALAAPRGGRGNPTPLNHRSFEVHCLARPVLEDGYPGWHQRGFGPEGAALAQRMVDLRHSLGLVDGEACRVSLDAEGFSFTGQPGTPPCHWATLVGQMPPAEIQRRKQLLAPTGDPR